MAGRRAIGADIPPIDAQRLVAGDLRRGQERRDLEMCRQVHEARRPARCLRFREQDFEPIARDAALAEGRIERCLGLGQPRAGRDRLPLHGFEDRTDPGFLLGRELELARQLRNMGGAGQPLSSASLAGPQPPPRRSSARSSSEKLVTVRVCCPA